MATFAYAVSDGTLTPTPRPGTRLPGQRSAPCAGGRGTVVENTCRRRRRGGERQRPGRRPARRLTWPRSDPWDRFGRGRTHPLRADPRFRRHRDDRLHGRRRERRHRRRRRRGDGHPGEQRALVRGGRRPDDSARTPVPRRSGGRPGYRRGRPGSRRQHVTFDVRTDNAALYARAVRPRLSPAGELAYTPARDATGWRRHGHAQDDGGRAERRKRRERRPDLLAGGRAGERSSDVHPRRGPHGLDDGRRAARSRAGFGPSVLGRPDEAAQSVGYVVSTSGRCALHAVRASRRSGSDGTLRFTPAVGMHG